MTAANASLEKNIDADELEWYVPSGIGIAELQRTFNVINQFLETPFELDGKKATELLTKKRRRRRRRSPSPDSENDDVLSGDQPRRKKRTEKKTKEKEIYKSAQFIQDSDEEYGDMDAFLEKEKMQREKANIAVATAGASRLPTMKATGTKKRRQKSGEQGSKSKKQKSSTASAMLGHQISDIDVERMHDGDGDVEIVEEDSHMAANGIISDQPSKQPSRPRPRPRPRPKGSGPTKPPPSSSTPSSGPDTHSSSPLLRHMSPEPEGTSSTSHTHRRRRLILSDDED